MYLCGNLEDFKAVVKLYPEAASVTQFGEVLTTLRKKTKGSKGYSFAKRNIGPYRTYL